MISVDNLEDNTRFAKEHDADYPILSDVTKEIANKYGVLSPAGFARRWTFYIAPDGKILHIDKEVKPATSGEDMVAKLGELKIAKSGK
jgi:thioredoxin-dependent peroxiredoxin